MSSKDALANAERNVTILASDISEDMKYKAIELTLKAERNSKDATFEKTLADNLKKEFDKKFNETWHCIVGKNFGSDIGFYENCMLYYQVQTDRGVISILLWKAG